MRDPHDIISRCHDCLLKISSGKTTVHVQWNCHGLSAHLPVSTPEPQMLQKLQTSLSLSKSLFHACDTYMKLIWCHGFTEIYAQLEEGVGLICHGCMCIVLYMKLMWCNGFPEVYASLEEGVGSIYHGYMCIVLYMKLMWCHGFTEIYAQLEEGWGQSAMGICALGYIYISDSRSVWCSGMQDIMFNWGG